MITSSPAVGWPEGLQFAAVVQLPPVVPTQVFVTALASNPIPRIREIKKAFKACFAKGLYVKIVLKRIFLTL